MSAAGAPVVDVDGLINDLITDLRGELAVLRGLANECLTLIATLEPESESEAYELALLKQRLEAAVDGSTVCPLFN